MNTAELTEAIMLAASTDGVLLVRNNSGVAKERNKDGSIRYIRYGVGTNKGGGGDLIGLTADGVFVSIELKVGNDSMKKLQKQWRGWINMRNGRAGVARSVEDARKIWNGQGGKI